MVEKIKFTKQLWKDFLDMAVDSSGSSGWKWFEDKYGFTSISFEKLLLVIQEKADKWDEIVKNPDYIEQTENALKSLREENKLLRQRLEIKID